VATKNLAPQSQILKIKRKLMEHIKANTSITEVGEDIGFSHTRKPFAILQIGPAQTDEDMNGVQDNTHSLGVRVVASDEDECWRAIEQVRLLWYGTGAESLFNELHQLGVLNISATSTVPGFQFSNGSELYCDLMYRVVIRYNY
jgi:hypothetical protein